jgi:hypothetical protein
MGIRGHRRAGRGRRGPAPVEQGQMSLLHFALMIAVAIEAAVIVALVVAFRRYINRPSKIAWEEPMPWMNEDRK